MIAFKQVLFPALVYPVAVMPLTEKECDDIIRPTMRALLKKLNIPVTTNRDLIYGPARHGGVELPNLYVHGNILKLMMFVGHYQKEDSTKPLLQIALGIVQQQLGTSTPALESDFNKVGFLVEACWIKHVWSFLTEINATIQVEQLWMPQSDYDNDALIMDKVPKTQLDEVTIQKFNMCRLFKQIYFISDILDSKQQKLHPMILDPKYRKSNTEKIPTIELPSSYWKIWTSVIKTLHASTRVSGFYVGAVARKNRTMWLQRLDRLYLLHRIEKKCFKVYKLSASQRNKYTYDKENYHESTFIDLGNFYNVAVRDLTLTCETDGFDEALLPTQLRHTSILNSIQLIIDLSKRLQHYVRRNAWTAPKTQ